MAASTAIIVLGIYGLIMVGISIYTNRKNGTGMNEYLLAGRKANWIVAAFSIAATWVWAPAIFVSAQKAFQQGIVGFGWFLIPNILTLIIFGLVAIKVREKFPKGYTLPEFMSRVYSPRVHKLYLVQFAVLQICSFAVQLLAGAGIISYLTGIPFWILTIVLALTALIYTAIGGFRASMITDFVQMIFMIGVGVVGVVLVVNNAGTDVIRQGFGGVSGLFGNFFDGNGIKVMLTFGLVNTIGLLAGPFGDQTFWQRMFAVPKRNIKKAYTLSAFIFAAIPILFGIIGFAGAGLGIDTARPDMINIEVISIFANPVLMAMVLMAILAGLGSTLDSNIMAITSLLSIDLGILTKGEKNRNLTVWREGMIIFVVIGILIANIPGLQILHLFLFYGTLRATTLIPTIVTIYHERDEKAVYRGLLASMVIGIPVFIWGSLSGLWWLKLIGALLAVGISGVMVITAKKVPKSKLLY